MPAPGCVLIWQRGDISVIPYHTLDRETDHKITADEAAEALRSKLEKAVNRQLQTPAEAGVLLSGGIDSATLTAFAAQVRPGINTFSFSLEAGADESSHAFEVAEKYGTKHHHYTDAGVDLAELLLKMPGIYDEPFADSSNIGTWLLAGHAALKAPYVLGGDGADALLGGNTTYLRILKAKEAEGISQKLKNRLRDLIRDYNPHFGKAGSHVWRHNALNVYFEDKDLARLGLPDLREYLLPLPLLQVTGTIEDALRMDLLKNLPGDLLVKSDRATMAHGLELRSPFLDNEVASFCLSLPPQLKVDTRQGKIILRKAMQGILPETILHRGKQGFGAPVKLWLKQEKVQQLKNDLLGNPQHALYHLIDFNAAQAYVRRDDYLTWALLVLAIWMDRYKSYYTLS